MSALAKEEKLIQHHRIIKHGLEIQNFFDRISRDRLEIVVWQSIRGLKRIVFNGHYKKNRITANDNKTLLKIDDYYPINIYCPYFNFVTRAEVDYIGRDYLRIDLPVQMHLEEKRGAPRTHFNSSKHTVSFIKQDVVYVCRLIDISVQGMAFKVHKELAKLFCYENDHILINEILGEKLPSTIYGSLRYLQNTDNSLRVGAMFQSKLDLSPII